MSYVTDLGDFFGGVDDAASSVGSSFSGAWDSVSSGISSASTWMNNNPAMMNMIGGIAQGVGTYYAIKKQHENEVDLMNRKNAYNDKMTGVPSIDSGYSDLTVSKAPNLASGGLLTKMQKGGK